VIKEEGEEWAGGGGGAGGRGRVGSGEGGGGIGGRERLYGFRACDTLHQDRACEIQSL